MPVLHTTDRRKVLRLAMKRLCHASHSLRARFPQAAAAHHPSRKRPAVSSDSSGMVPGTCFARHGSYVQLREA